MKALDRKLLRDLGTLKGQVLTIAMVVACGIGAYLSMQSAWASLEQSRDAFYERYRMGDVFASLTRAPNAVAERTLSIPGVAQAYPRMVEELLVPISTLDSPASGRLISLPDAAEAPLNHVHLTRGRMPVPGPRDEVLLIETFAEAHALNPGDTLPAVVNGRFRKLYIVGVGIAPDHLFPVLPPDFTADNKRFAVMWMAATTMAQAYRMEGAFNDLSLRLHRSTDEAEVLRQLDDLLAPYGGVGAVARDKQLSNFILEGEMSQLEQMATVVPFIFLGVAALLLNIVLGRLVNLQRQQIAALEALGYAKSRIALHYLELVSVVVVLGALGGVALGAWMGDGLTAMYARFFRFPTLDYTLPASRVATGIGISLLAAVAGAWGALHHVFHLPPAEAMRPPTPARYKPSPWERLHLNRVFGHSATMVGREIWRRPWRTLLSSVGIAASIGICIVGRFSSDAFDYLIHELFHRAQRNDMTVYFVDPLDRPDLRSFEHIPGVLDVEGVRTVPVRFMVAHRWRDSAISGLSTERKLRRLISRRGEDVGLPSQGLLMTSKLAEILHVGIGDEVIAEIREGERRRHRLTLGGLIDEPFGLNGYLSSEALHRLLGERPRVTEVLLRTDPQRRNQVQAELREMPGAWRISKKTDLLDNFSEQTGESMAAMTLILTLFAATIAVGVVYNNARVTLSIRNRDLASLRVLGFTQGEISTILLGELAVQIAIAIPIGLAMGRWWCHALMATADPEAYRLPIVISGATYAFAVAVTVAAGLVSALLVRRKLDRLDLIAVLKTRE